MLVILRISRGPQVGVSRALMPGQRALVGCGNWSHFPVDDGSIGDPQFLIQHDPTGVEVKNVSETSMLFVNGLRTVCRKLTDGDVISVGDCEFTVEIRGAHGHLGHLNLPLVGSIQLSDDFGLSVTESDTGAADRWKSNNHSSRFLDGVHSPPQPRLWCSYAARAEEYFTPTSVWFDRECRRD